jgi:hypothetical protein
VRLGLVGLGMLLVATGTVWIVQGIGVLEGSFMTGQAFWAWTGAIAVLIGLPLIVQGFRRG